MDQTTPPQVEQTEREAFEAALASITGRASDLHEFARLMWQAGRASMQAQAPRSAEPTWFPLLGTVFAIRWDALNERQAQANHFQSLKRLAERGGLSPAEALAVVREVSIRHVKASDGLRDLAAVVSAARPSETGGKR